MCLIMFYPFALVFHHHHHHHFETAPAEGVPKKSYDGEPWPGVRGRVQRQQI